MKKILTLGFMILIIVLITSTNGFAKEAGPETDSPDIEVPNIMLVLTGNGVVSELKYAWEIMAEGYRPAEGETRARLEYQLEIGEIYFIEESVLIGRDYLCFCADKDIAAFGAPHTAIFNNTYGKLYAIKGKDIVTGAEIYGYAFEKTIKTFKAADLSVE